MYCPADCHPNEPNSKTESKGLHPELIIRAPAGRKGCYMDMIELENQFLKIGVASDGSSLILNGYGQTYESGHIASACYGGDWVPLDLPAFGRTTVCREHNELVITVREIIWYARFPGHTYCKPDPGPDLHFTFRIRLEKDEAVFLTEVPENLDDEILSVEFPKKPLRWNTAREGYLAGTFSSLGSLFRFPNQKSYKFSSDAILPVAGYFNELGGIGICHHGFFDCKLETSVNQTAGTGECGFQTEFVKGKSEYSREIRVKLFERGANYVTLAKWYRNVVKREGRFVSLAEKIDASPEVARLAGSVIWKHNVFPKPVLPPGIERDYSLYVRDRASAEAEGKPNNWTAKEVFDTARTAGFDRVCILNTGWNNQGFDSGYPTRFPVNPQRGTGEDFIRAAEYGRSLSPDYIFSVHDNYRDVYPNSPEFKREELFYDADGAPVKGGIWRGGRCYLMCSQCAWKYAQRDLPRIAEMCGRGAIYLDVQGCVAQLNCFHPEHPGGRKDDAAGRIKIIQLAKKYMGAVATEGAPHEFAVPSIDLGAYPLIQGYSSFGGLPIPFFQLVYHDSVYNFAGQGVSGVHGYEYVNRVALYGMLPWDFSADSLRISREMRQTCGAEMLTHEFISEKVEKTVFSDGRTVVANFGDAPYEQIKPFSFAIL